MRFLGKIVAKFAARVELLDLGAARLPTDGHGTVRFDYVFTIFTHLQRSPNSTIERIFLLILLVCFLSHFKCCMRGAIRYRHGSSSRTVSIFVVHGRHLRNGIARNHEWTEQGLEKVLRE